MNRPIARYFALVGLLVLFACSTDSPTAPVQQPPPADPPPPSAVWNITLNAEPDEIPAGSTTPAQINVRVRRANGGQAPPDGTTIVVSSTLGEFGAEGSGQNSAVVTLFSGRGAAQLFPGTVPGVALVTARLESSSAQTSVPIGAEIEPVVASFEFQNTNVNLSVLFRNTSTGNPTEFFWEFGDGGTSTLEHPNHIYRAAGDYVVSLTASKPGSSDTTSQFVEVAEEPFIDGLEPDDGNTGTVVTITGTGFQNLARVFFDTVPADIQSFNSESIVCVVPVPRKETVTESCTIGEGTGAVEGFKFKNVFVSVQVELSNGTSDTLQNGFAYIFPDTETCFPN